MRFLIVTARLCLQKLKLDIMRVQNAHSEISNFAADLRNDVDRLRTYVQKVKVCLSTLVRNSICLHAKPLYRTCRSAAICRPRTKSVSGLVRNNGSCSKMRTHASYRRWWRALKDAWGNMTCTSKSSIASWYLEGAETVLALMRGVYVCL
jgi:hypothetical protein